MNVHEFGERNERVILMIHPSVVRWDYFEQVIPLLEKEYRVLVPALPGYDPDDPGDFTSVERIAAELGDWVRMRGIKALYAVYGCSMGGSIALMTAVYQAVPIRHCIMDGGITPYQLPWIATRFIALRDYLLMMTGRIGGMKLLKRAFAMDGVGQEELRYGLDVLRSLSRRTIWRTFDSCNNYKMPNPIPAIPSRLHYWYAQGETKERAWDIRYMGRHFPQTEFRVLPDLGHGGLVWTKPELFVQMIGNLDEDRRGEA